MWANLGRTNWNCVTFRSQMQYKRKRKAEEVFELCISMLQNIFSQWSTSLVRKKNYSIVALKASIDILCNPFNRDQGMMHKEQKKPPPWNESRMNFNQIRTQIMHQKKYKPVLGQNSIQMLLQRPSIRSHQKNPQTKEAASVPQGKSSLDSLSSWKWTFQHSHML